MAGGSGTRRQKVLLAILGVLVLVFIGRTAFSSGGDDSSGSSATTSVEGTSATSTVATTTAATSTTVPGDPLPPDSFDVYSTRNPFEPAFQETPTTVAWTTTTTGFTGTTATTGSAGTTTTIGGGGTTTSTQPSYNPQPGTTVALLDIYLDGATVMARVQVASTVYTVVAGDLFGPNNSYRVVSLDEPCGQFLYGDSPFELCEGQQVIK